MYLVCMYTCMRMCVCIVCVGNATSAALDAKGRVYTWGCGLRGSLGHGDTKDRPCPEPVAAFGDGGVSLIAAGDSFMLAADNAGVWGWGRNCEGQLGLEGVEDVMSPRRLPCEELKGGNITLLEAGRQQSAAVIDGVLYTWGANNHGMLARKPTETLGPQKVATVSEVSS